MDRLGEANDDDEVFRSRYLYICDVIDSIYTDPLSFPDADLEKLYDDALRHLGRLLSPKSSNERKKEALRSCSMKRCRQKRSRKEILKEILDLLLCLQRECLYDPPADDEIGYYFLIKQYIRSIIAFFQPAPAMGNVQCGPGYGLFDCYEGILGLLHVEELSENQHLADLAVFASETDFTNGSSVTPLMGINEKIGAHPLIVGSKERSFAFYLDKFNLAMLDLRSTEFAHCPPTEEEKRLYVQIMNDFPCTSSDETDETEEPNVFSDMLCYLFIERIEHEIKDLERHCRRIKDVIVDKLSLTERYEWIYDQFKLEVRSYKKKYDLFEIDEEVIVLPNFKRKLVQKWEVCGKELTNYVRCIDQYLRIMVNVGVFIISRLSDDEGMCNFVSDLLLYKYNRDIAGWFFLHCLMIIKQGRFFFGTVLKEPSIAQISKKRACGEFLQESKWIQKCSTKEGKNENLKILRGIVEDLRCIGVSDMKTDDEEGQLLHKIWQNVASSIQFFLSAITYDRGITLASVGVCLMYVVAGRIPGFRTTQRKRFTTMKQIHNRLEELALEVSDMSFILAALRDVLLEKTGKDGPDANAM